MHTATLAALPVNGSLQITKIDDGLPIKTRLGELGFLKGAVVDKLYVGFGGSPIAVRVSGAVIAVRTRDAEGINGIVHDMRAAV